MKPAFLYHPVGDLDVAVSFYRDVLGLDEAWRMGDETAAFALPNSDVQVMLDVTDAGDGPSGFFEVDDVDAFYAERAESVTWVTTPEDLPPVRHAAFKDPSGNLFRIFHSLE